MTIETERLILRKIDVQDTDAIFEYSKEPNVGPNAGWKPHDSKEETLKIMETVFLKKETVWGIVLKEYDQLIGSIGLIPDPKRENNKAKMIGYAISEKHWGKGIMTEAVQSVVQCGFVDFNLDLISAYCFPFNTRSKKVLLKTGFTYEGTLKLAEVLYNGDVHDHECYAFSAKEYNAE